MNNSQSTEMAGTPYPHEHKLAIRYQLGTEIIRGKRFENKYEVKSAVPDFIQILDKKYFSKDVLPKNDLIL